MAEYWTIVDKDKTPILPYDCNPDFEDDEGMLVYRSIEAAFKAGKHQHELYDIECFPCELGKEKVRAV